MIYCEQLPFLKLNAEGTFLNFEKYVEKHTSLQFDNISTISGRVKGHDNKKSSKKDK